MKSNISQRGSLNLELSLIIALLIITGVAGLTFLGGRVTNSFVNGADILKYGGLYGNIKVVITSPEGTPVSGVDIGLVKNNSALNNRQNIASAATTLDGTTDTNGIIVFEQIPVASYNVVVKDTNYIPQNGDQNNKSLGEVKATAKDVSSITGAVIPITPNKPENVNYNLINSNLSISWNDPTKLGVTITEYKIQYDTNPTFIQPREASVSSSEGLYSYNVPIAPVNTYVRLKSVSSTGLSSDWVNVGTSFKSSPVAKWTDGFDRTDATFVNNSWDGTAGFGITSNQLNWTSTTNPIGYAALWHLATVNDNTLEIKWTKIATRDAASLVGLSLLNQNNGFYNPGAAGYSGMITGNGEVFIYYWHDGGTETRLATKTGITINEGSTFAFRRVGSKLQCIVDGKVVLETTHSAVTNFVSTYINVRSPYQKTNNWDNFKIYLSSEYNPI